LSASIHVLLLFIQIKYDDDDDCRVIGRLSAASEHAIPADRRLTQKRITIANYNSALPSPPTLMRRAVTARRTLSGDEGKVSGRLSLLPSMGR